MLDSDNVIQISVGINLVLIHCDLIDGAYNDGIRTNTIFSFSAYSTPIGYKFNMEPKKSGLSFRVWTKPHIE